MASELFTYGTNFAPAVAITAIALVVLLHQRLGVASKIIGMGLWCAAMLPIRLWEPIVIAVGATIATVLTEQLVTLLERKTTHRFATTSSIICVIILPALMVLRHATPALHWVLELAEGTLIVLVACGCAWRFIRKKREGVEEAKTIPRNEAPSVRMSLRQLLACVLGVAIILGCVRIAWPRCDHASAAQNLMVGMYVGCALALMSWLQRIGQGRLVLLLFAAMTARLTSLIWTSLEPELKSWDLMRWSLVDLNLFLIGVGVAVVMHATIERPSNRGGRVMLIGLQFIVVAALLVPTTRLYVYMFRPSLGPLEYESVDGNQYEYLVSLIDQADVTLPTAERAKLLDEISELVRSDAPIKVNHSASGHYLSRREAVRLFVSDSETHMASGENQQGIDQLLAAIHMNHRIAIGGGSADRLVRMACNDMPFTALLSLRRSLTPQELAQVQASLQETLKIADSIDEVAVQQGKIAYAEHRWIDVLTDYDFNFEDGLFAKSILDQPLDRMAHDYFLEDDIWIEVLIVDCAIRRYRFANATYPESLRELVPEYLGSVPNDPFADQPLSYKRQADGYYLYSFGHNRVDDHGERLRFVGDIALGEPIQ